MEAICGIGIPEFLFIALIGFVVIGPERARSVALSAGRSLRTIMKSEWWGEINDVTRAMRDLPNTLIRMAELEEAQTELRNTLRDIDEAARFDVPAPTRKSHSRPSNHTDKTGVITDPWGISNAVAGTQMPPGPPESKSGDGDDTIPPTPAR